MHYRLCGLEMGHISRCIMNVFAASYDISKASLEGQESNLRALATLPSHAGLYLCAWPYDRASVEAIWG